MPDAGAQLQRALVSLRGIAEIPVLLTGLTKAETAILSELSGCARPGEAGTGERSLTGTQLAKRLEVSPGGISQAVSALVDKGYVKRIPDTKDRRVVHVELTDTGRVLGQRLSEGFHALVSGILCGLGPEDAEMFAALLERASRIASRIVARVRKACAEGRDPIETLREEDECENTSSI